ncbi:MAG: hypothetical protein ACRCW7_07150 [Cetobacterium sp.]
MARENKEIAAFAGLMGYISMQLETNFYLSERGLLDVVDTRMVMGIQSIDTGALGALICGVMVMDKVVLSYSCRNSLVLYLLLRI